MAQLVLALGQDGTGAKSAIVAGTICMPRVGAWTADLVVDSAAAIAKGRAVIVTPGIALKGSIIRSGTVAGMQRVRMVAGAGGLQKTATPKHYTSPVLNLPLQALAETAGEALASTNDAEITGATLLNWTTIGVSVGAMLAALVDAAPDGTAWRFLPDGTLWIGRESWPKSAVTSWRELDGAPENGAVVLGLDSPDVVPGTKLGDYQVDYVEHRVEGGKLRSVAWTFEDGGAMDRVKGPMLALARAGGAPHQYRALYRARLISQAGDLQKCGVQPDDERLPPMENIPLRHGVPGLFVRVQPGAHVLVGFENGAPDRPWVGLWETDANALEIRLGANLTAAIHGVVLGSCPDPFTGSTHTAIGGASGTVMAQK